MTYKSFMDMSSGQETFEQTFFWDMAHAARDEMIAVLRNKAALAKKVAPPQITHSVDHMMLLIGINATMYLLSGLVEIIAEADGVSVDEKVDQFAEMIKVGIRQTHAVKEQKKRGRI